MKFGSKIKFLDKKGIAVTWLALGLFVLLLMLAGMAIDIAYMYNAKNQLQVAADAAALAGAAVLDGTSSTSQPDSRQTAWKFACKNRAAGANVYLVTNSSTNCDSPPPGSSLNGSNSANGDIVVGLWSGGPDIDPSGTPVNAVKVVARRTADSTGGPVQVFWGQIFRMIGADWSFMSAAATAIATKPPRATSFIAMGNTACPAGCNYPSLPCPLSETSYAGACTAAGNPYPCCTGLGTGTCSARVLAAEPTVLPDDHKFAWTSLLDNPGECGPFRTDFICEEIPFQNVCGRGIFGISGTCTAALRDYESVMFDPNFDAANKEKNASGNVIGWWVMIPQNTIPDPMFGPDPHDVAGYILVHIIAVCAPGAPGCRGYEAPSSLCAALSMDTGSGGIAIDQIQCISCSDISALGLLPALVR